MAKFYIAEYADITETVRGSAQAPKDPPAVEQTIIITGAAAQSAAFGATTRFILITTDAICSILVGGTNPIATQNSHRLPADQAQFRGVLAGDKLSVIANT